MLCLDNDVFRKYTSGPPDPSVVEYLEANHSEVWLLPSVVLFECLQKYDSHSEIKTMRDEVEKVVDDVIALDLADLLVAASARQADATLVTGNKADFDTSPVHELLDVEIIEFS